MSLSLKDDVFKAVYGYTPKFGKPTPPPPPKTGSKVQVKKKYCTCETPCGWCTKWDKKCDRKIPEPPVINQYDYSTIKMCQSKEDHQWVCCGISSVGSTYYCTVCGKHKTEPIKRQDNVTISTYSSNEIYHPCSECDHEGWDMPECKECNAANDFKYFRGKNTK